MKGMENISEAILDKVRADAQEMIQDAEDKARRELEAAQKQRETRFEEEKAKNREAAQGAAARIMAQASMKARQELLSAKAGIVDEIVSQVKNNLATATLGSTELLALINEAAGALGSDKAVIYVSPGDTSTVQQLLQENKGLAERIIEVKELDRGRGVIAEDIDGKIRIDNTFDTRLEILLPKLLPEISKTIFQG